jgi:hypothetical protein
VRRFCTDQDSVVRVVARMISRFNPRCNRLPLAPRASNDFFALAMNRFLNI